MLMNMRQLESCLDHPLRTSGACHLTVPPLRDDDDEVAKVVLPITKAMPKSAITALW